MWKPLRSRLIRYILPFAAILAALLTQGAVALAVPKGVDFPYAFFYLMAVFAVAWYGEKGMAGLIIFSQVVLSAQLSFAIVPLIQFTSSRAKMGPFVNGPLTRYTGWTLAAVIAVLNVYLIYTSLQ